MKFAKYLFFACQNKKEPRIASEFFVFAFSNSPIYRCAEQRGLAPKVGGRSASAKKRRLVGFKLSAYLPLRAWKQAEQ